MTQPMLGILTLYLNEQKQLEERSIYQRMIAAGKRIGLNVFVFTPQDVNEQSRRISGQFYNFDNARWVRKSTPFPDMIFDRCRLQNSYRFEQLRRFRSKHRHLAFLNRPLRNKWIIYQALQELPDIQQHLPKTKLYSSISDVERMMKTEPIIYLKPINGTGGRGILRLERLKSTKLQVYVQGRDRYRRIIIPQRMTWTQLALKLASWNAKGRYLFQQGIALNLSNGRVHDYRMLVQKNGEGQWEVTGCAGRIGAAKSITSNLHGGGEAIKMNTLLRQWVGSEEKMLAVKDTAGQIGIKIASFLEAKYGALLELALDLAIERSGKIWLLEVNPKPSREVFSRIGDRETYRLAISRPMEYAMWYYNSHLAKDNAKPESKRKGRKQVTAPATADEALADILQEIEMTEIPLLTSESTQKEQRAPSVMKQGKRNGTGSKTRSNSSKPYFPSAAGKAASSRKNQPLTHLEHAHSNELIDDLELIGHPPVPDGSNIRTELLMDDTEALIKLIQSTSSTDSD
ncbi:YheC/YheD family endospore coat-associated protein [Paenibacillus marinisediminis]